jgi:uncharacterized protein (DUF2237 family)
MMYRLNRLHSIRTEAMPSPLNVLGGPLECCCLSPKTGYYRDGFCKTDESDRGRHTVCAKVTRAFLDYSRSKGNDLMTPAPHYSFPGLKDGDKWCLCVSRWKEAYHAGVAPPVYLKACHINALETVTLAQLKEFAVEQEESKVDTREEFKSK